VRRWTDCSTIIGMTPRPTTSKLLLIAEGRAAGDGEPVMAVRRFRLARIVAGGQTPAAQGRRPPRAA
jgi:hypothetical protein